MSELSERIQDVISNEPVAVFIKGTPQIPMCGPRWFGLAS